MANIGSLFQRDGKQADRGQLLALTGVLLAVTLVLLAVLVSNGIYAQNIGTEGSDIGDREPVDLEHSLSLAAEDFLITINEGTNETGNHDFLTEQFTMTIGTWSEHSSQHVIRDRGYSTVSVNETTNGTQIRQNESGFFESAGGDNNWQLTREGEDVHVRNYVIEVDSASQQSDLDNLIEGSDDPFSINVSDGESTWELFIYENNSSSENTMLAAEVNGEFTSECDAGSQAAVVDFSNATVNGEFCEAAVFASGLEPPYAISYNNGSTISGEYRLIVDDPGLEASASFADPGTGQPYAVSGIYSAELALRYRHNQIAYESTLMITPRENYA